MPEAELTGTGEDGAVLALSESEGVADTEADSLAELLADALADGERFASALDRVAEAEALALADLVASEESGAVEAAVVLGANQPTARLLNGAAEFEGAATVAVGA